jgi:hypothetical protein
MSSTLVKPEPTATSLTQAPSSTVGHLLPQETTVVNRPLW